MTEWKFRDTGVKIQDIHDDRVKVPGHRVKIQDIHDDSGGSSETQGWRFRTFTMTVVKVPGHRGEDSGHSR